MKQKPGKEEVKGAMKKEKGASDELKKRLESKVLGMMASPKEDPDKKKKEEKVPEQKEPEKKQKDRGKGAEKAPNEEGAGLPEEPAPENKGKRMEPQSKKPEKEEQIPAETLEELLSQREEVETLLASIEDSYRDATLPDTTYQEVKTENEKKLAEINRKIEAVKKAFPEKIPAPGKREMPEEQARPAPRQPQPPAEALPRRAEPRGEESKAFAIIRELEGRIEERFKDAIASASVEVTDKRIRKVDERLDVIESEIKDLKKSAEIVSGFDKQFNIMNGEVERTKALVESTKESRGLMDDKLQHIVESFAEIRSIVYQREAASKEQEVLLDKLKDAMSKVDTARILREFTVRDEQIKDVNTRLEKLERGVKMLSDSNSKIKGLLTDVGSLENILKASKMVKEKLERIQEIEERMKANSSRLDGVYVDMKKKLDEFSTYKVKQDKLEGMANDIFRNVEELTRRLTDFVTKDDLDAARKLIQNTKEELVASIEISKRTASPSLPLGTSGLQEEKEEIESLLSMLEENLKNKEISEEEYNNAKSKNLQKLRGIEEKMESYSRAPPGKGKMQEGQEEEGGGRHSRTMLLAKLRASYENGELSKAAYDKSKKLLLGKG